jgi:hypothetical protein
MDDTTRLQPNDPTGEDALRELALRLLTFHFGHLCEQQGQEPQLLVGQLPPDLPVDLPVPQGSRLLGSLAEESPIIAIDTELAREDVVAFYRERLAAARWSEQEDFGPRHGGFVHSRMYDGTMANFFTPDDRYTLGVMTAPAPAGRTTVQLTLRGGTAQFHPQHRPQHRDVMVVLPPIRPPTRAMQMPGGGTSGDDHVSTSATLECNLDVPALSAHYSGEFTRADWRQLDAGASGPAAWSVWSFTDQQGTRWQALFFIIQRPGRQGQYALTLRADAEDDGRQHSREHGTSYRVVRSSVVSSGLRIGMQQVREVSPPADAPEPEPPTAEGDVG